MSQYRLSFSIWRGDTLMATAAYAEDAAAILGFLGPEGSYIKYYNDVVYDGDLDPHPADSYDAAAMIMYDRIGEE